MRSYRGFNRRFSMSFYDVSARAICGKRLKNRRVLLYVLIIVYCSIAPRYSLVSVVFTVIVAVFRGKRSFRVLFLMCWQMCLWTYTVVFRHGSVDFVDIRLWVR